MSQEWSQFPEASPLDVALHAEGVDGRLADVARSVYQQESSSGRNTATSNAGARGGMQVMPATFQRVADKGWNMDDPVHNARAGVRYLKTLHERGGGDPLLTAAGYYGGEGGQDKARQGIAVRDPRNPSAPDTLQYAREVTARMPTEQTQPADQDLSWLEQYPVADAPAPDSARKPLPTGVRPSTAGAGRGGVNPPAATPPAPRNTVEELGRQLGLTVRAGAKGLASVPGLVVDAVTGPANAAADAIAGKGNGPRIPTTAASVDRALDALGLPKPENATERVVQDVAAAMAGAGGSVKAAEALGQVASPVASAVGKKLAEGAGMQVASAGAGAGAAGVTRESGGGEGAQIAAGIAGSLAPGFAAPAAKETARRLLRGGEAGRQRVAENLATFEAAGTTPTLGQATEGRIARATESLLAKTPGGAGVIAAKAAKQSEEMAAAVQRISDELAPGASAVTAGEAIERGVQKFKDAFKAGQKLIYQGLDQEIPNSTRIPVSRTRQALADLNADIEGAPALSQWFKNARIKGLEGGLAADSGGVDAVLTRPGMKEYVDQMRANLLEQARKATQVNRERRLLGMNNLEPVLTPQQIEEQITGFLQGKVDERLPYESLKKLRTLVGNEISDGSLVADVPRSKWRALYAALSDDLGEAAKAAGPKAEAAWSQANAFTSQHMELLDQLGKVVSRDSPEKIFRAAIAGSAEGDTMVKRVMNALPAAERREVAAAVLQRLGRATAGQQNAEGDAFSSETFLSNLAKLSAPAKKAIFGSTDNAEIEQRVALIGKIAENRREGGRVFANPSGTAAGTAQLAVGGGIGGGVATALLTGNPAAVALPLAAPLAANAAARAVTSPKFVRALAEQTTVRAGAPAAAVGAAARAIPPSQPEHAWLDQYPEVDAADLPAGIRVPAAPAGPAAGAPAAAGTMPGQQPEAPGTMAPQPGQAPDSSAADPGSVQQPVPGQSADAAQAAPVLQVAAPAATGDGEPAGPTNAEGQLAQAPAAQEPPAPIAQAEQAAPPRRTIAERIQAFYDAGERDMAQAMLEREQRRQLADAAAQEVQAFARAAPSPVFADPQFARTYGEMRRAGALPGEAAARAALGTVFSQTAAAEGLGEAALRKVQAATADLPPQRAALVLSRLAANLAERGRMRPEAAAALAEQLQQTWEHAIDATLAAAYPEETPAPEVDRAEAGPAQPSAVERDAVAQAGPASASDAVEQLSAGAAPAHAGADVAADAASDAPTFASSRLRDGTLALRGDPRLLRDTLVAAGVPAKSLFLTERGVLVGRTAADQVEQAIKAMGDATAVDHQAHAAASSPLNDRPEPTPAQAAAGNYKVGKFRLHGLEVAIENPRGSVRRGTDPDGKAWESKLAAHYGRLARTVGADGDQVDVFIGPSPGSQRVFVVDQLDANGGFDEHKALLGFRTEKEARDAYLGSYEPSWERRIGAITELPMAAFKAWVRDGKKREPLGALQTEQDA